ncbi:MAG TPA: hypothetical protein VNV61_07950 [Steroidobacteraceae bacterium]|jgi:hypothetical protein|nr:hypothetical protein [Steroidobacteraceae bacterium]
MDDDTRWKPNDIIRLVVVIGSFLLFFVGVWLLVKGIAAEGTVNLKSALLSGTIKATSAGLYICFFAVFVLFAALAALPRSKAQPVGRPERMMRLFWGLLVAMVFCTVGFAVTGSAAFSGAIGILLVTLGSVVFSILND